MLWCIELNRKIYQLIESIKFHINDITSPINSAKSNATLDIECSEQLKVLKYVESCKLSHDIYETPNPARACLIVLACRVSGCHFGHPNP